MPEIKFVHGNESKSVDITDKEFGDGPPYEGDDEEDQRQDYLKLTSNRARRAAWRAWLGEYGPKSLSQARVQAVKEATAAREAGRYQSIDQVNSNKDRNNKIKSIYVQLVDPITDKIQHPTYGEIPRTTKLSIDRGGKKDDLIVKTELIDMGCEGVVGYEDGKIAHDLYVNLDLLSKITATEIYFADPTHEIAGLMAQANSPDLDYTTNSIPPPDTFELCSKVFRTNRAKALITVAGLLIFGGLATVVGLPIRRRNRMAAPGNLTVEKFFDHDVQQFVLIASWTAPASNSAKPPSLEAATYQVTLYPENEAPVGPDTVAIPSWTSPIVELGGTYTIGVRAITRAGDESREICSDAITIPASPDPALSGKPGDPQGVTLKQVTIGAGRAALRVSWSHPTTGSSPNKYDIELTRSAGTEVTATVAANMTAQTQSHDFIEALVSDTYTATVTGVIGALKSQPIASVPVAFSAAPTAPPGAPTDLDVTLSVAADGSQQTVVDLSWRPATNGPPLSFFTLTRSENGNEIERLNIIQQTHSFPPVDDGNYEYAVTASNNAGTSAAIRQTVNVVFSKVDPTVINWDMLISAADKQKWDSELLFMNNQNQQQFWAQALNTVSTGNNGSIASFSNQLILAALYRTLITNPTNEPGSALVASWARQLNQAHTPQLNTPDTEWWQQATNLSFSTGAIPPVRFQLAGLMRALEDLLGVEHSIK